MTRRPAGQSDAVSAKPSAIRVLIADDHPVVRAGLKGLLDGAADFEVVGEASDGLEAVARTAELSPDVVLMDLRMPNLDGVAAIRRIRAADPEARVLVLTTYDSDADILPAIEAGATGYLLKAAPRDELFDAVRRVAAGETTLEPTVAARIVARLRQPEKSSLSAREIEVLTHLARGEANKEIARGLHISEATVKTHLIHVYRKLGVDGRTAAVTKALETGIIRLEGADGTGPSNG